MSCYCLTLSLIVKTIHVPNLEDKPTKLIDKITSIVKHRQLTSDQILNTGT